MNVFEEIQNGKIVSIVLCKRWDKFLVSYFYDLWVAVNHCLALLPGMKGSALRYSS